MSCDPVNRSGSVWLFVSESDGQETGYIAAVKSVVNVMLTVRQPWPT